MILQITSFDYAANQLIIPAFYGVIRCIQSRENKRMLLKDKVVLVTGSTNGIGKAIAKRCVQEGAKVMIHGRSEQRAKALQDELGADNSTYVIGELTNPSIHQTIIQAVEKAYGRLDVLVNNAGIYPRSSIDTITPDLFDKVMTVNFKAPMFLIQAALPLFRQQGGGTVVNIGSINAYCGEINMSIYAPSKGALMTMTRNLGNELSQQNVRINLLNVGWTLTETENELKRSEGFSGDWQADIPKTFAPTGRLLRPEQIAHHAVFWASDDSAPATGQVYDLEQYPVIGRNLIYTIASQSPQEAK